MQKSRTSDMVFNVPRLIASLSAIVPLLPGDLIFTGTPAGIGWARDPKIILRGGNYLGNHAEAEELLDALTQAPVRSSGILLGSNIRSWRWPACSRGGAGSLSDPAHAGVTSAVPSESTFRRTLQRLHADAFDDLMGAWA